MMTPSEIQNNDKTAGNNISTSEAPASSSISSAAGHTPQTDVNPTDQTQTKSVANTVPSAKTGRPQPIPKVIRGTHTDISIRKIWRTTKQKFIGSSKKTMDARSKKTATLASILLVVFIAVLSFALGSGPKQAKASGNKKESASLTQRISSSAASTETWTPPKAFTAEMRDPTNSTSRTSGSGSNATGARSQSDNLMVSGIVYSNKKSSAIIANEVVFEGDTIDGVTIVKIRPDFVEFEKAGKRWQQQVKE